MISGGLIKASWGKDRMCTKISLSYSRSLLGPSQHSCLAYSLHSGTLLVPCMHLARMPCSSVQQTSHNQQLASPRDECLSSCYV